MAEPARESAADPGPDKARPRKSDPLSPGWVNVQRAMIHGQRAMDADIRLLVLTAREAAAQPRNPALLELLTLAVEIAREHDEIGREHGEIARRCALEESILVAREEAAYARGVADCKAARARLGAVPGPH